MRTMKLSLAASLVVAGLLITSPATAAQGPSGQFEVSATVVSNCRLTVGPLQFGTYDPLQAHASSPLDASTDLTLSCTRGSGATIALDYGRNGINAQKLRRMANQGQLLNYLVFRDSSRTQNWGDGADALSMQSSGTGGLTVTVYGRIPGGQDVLAGAYNDLITASVEF